MALGVEHANDGSAASVNAGARNQGWSRSLELAVIEAAREPESFEFARRRRSPPNFGLLRTKDRPPNSEFSPYAGPQGPW
jgi:hypothetical protein